jgi:hypothetical protein
MTTEARLETHTQRPYTPDAAIVNYYHAGDHLSGHRDDVEPDLEQPIVSVSLGCPGIFLLGGRTLDEEPLALLLRSGDVVVLTAEARLCFHGAGVTPTKNDRFRGGHGWPGSTLDFSQWLCLCESESQQTLLGSLSTVSGVQVCPVC